MRIEEFVLFNGPGLTVHDVFSRVKLARPEEEIDAGDISTALQIAAWDGKVRRAGAFWWRKL